MLFFLAHSFQCLNTLTKQTQQSQLPQQHESGGCFFEPFVNSMFVLVVVFLNFLFLTHVCYVLKINLMFVTEILRLIKHLTLSQRDFFISNHMISLSRLINLFFFFPLGMSYNFSSNLNLYNNMHFKSDSQKKKKKKKKNA